MKFSWKIAAPVFCLAVICGAALSWKFYEKRKADELKLVEAAKTCRISAEQGDAQAQYKIGYMYSHGQGVPQDIVEAIRWYKKSADQGNAMGESALGTMYVKGRGIEQNYNEALKWYNKAADQDYATAQYCLGQMYYYGEGVPQNNAEAASWYRKAADWGYSHAQANLGYMYSYGYGVQRDRAEAERWYHKAADQGDEYAQRALGMRVPVPNSYGKTGLFLAFSGGILLLFSFQSTKQSFNRQQKRITTLAGILLLFYVGLNLFGIFCIGIFHSIIAVNSLYFVKSIIAGILPVMLISIVLPKRFYFRIAKVVLGVSIIFFIIFNLMNIYIYYKSHNTQIFRCLPNANGFLIGLSISLTIYLRNIHYTSSDEQNDYGDVTTLETATDSKDESNPENEERSDAD
jgi:hypothetical protein